MPEKIPKYLQWDNKAVTLEACKGLAWASLRHCNEMQLEHDKQNQPKAT